MPTGNPQPESNPTKKTYQHTTPEGEETVVDSQGQTWTVERDKPKTDKEKTEETPTEEPKEGAQERKPFWTRKKIIGTSILAGLGIGGGVGVKKLGDYQGWWGSGNNSRTNGTKQAQPPKQTDTNMNGPYKIPASTNLSELAKTVQTNTPPVAPVAVESALTNKSPVFVVQKTEAEIRAELQTEYDKKLAEKEVAFSNRLFQATNSAPKPPATSEPFTTEMRIKVIAQKIMDAQRKGIDPGRVLTADEVDFYMREQEKRERLERVGKKYVNPIP